MATFLHEAGVTFNREERVVFSTKERTNSARIDFVIYRDWGQVLLEVDECQHRYNPVADECSRMSRILAEMLLQERAEKIHVVRFNPDAYMEGTRRPKTPLADRLQALLRAIQMEPPKQQSISYLYYTRDDCPLPKVCLDREYLGSLRAIVNLQQ